MDNYRKKSDKYLFYEALAKAPASESCISRRLFKKIFVKKAEDMQVSFRVDRELSETQYLSMTIYVLSNVY